MAVKAFVIVIDDTWSTENNMPCTADEIESALDEGIAYRHEIVAVMEVTQ